MIKLIPNTQNRTVFIEIDNAPDKVKKGLRLALTEIGKENVRHLKNLIKKPPKTGRLYGSHRASAPGEAPANWTGKLLRSVKYRVYGWSKMEFGDGQPYGLFLEGGTKTKDGTKKMAARPHLKTTVREKSKDNFNSLLTNVDKVLKK